MASNKLFGLCNLVFMLIYTNLLYASCSTDMLKGSYTFQANLQIQGRQCHLSGTWLMDGKGGGWDESASKGGNSCPDLTKSNDESFRYQVGADCKGQFVTYGGDSYGFLLMPDGTIRLFLERQDEATGTFNRPLSSDEIKTIGQGQVNWNNKGDTSDDLPFYQTTWQQLQAKWRALTFKVSTQCPTTKLQGNYTYQGKFTIAGKPCQGTGNWLFNNTGSGWINGKTLCPGQKEIKVTKPFRYEFDNNCRITLKVLNASEEGNAIELLDGGRLRLTFAAQAKAIVTFNYTLTEKEANVIREGLTDWNHAEIRERWNHYLLAGLTALHKGILNSGNVQDAEKNFQAAFELAKTKTSKGVSWDELIENGIKAGNAGNYKEVQRQYKKAYFFYLNANTLHLGGQLRQAQGNMEQAGSFFQQCLNTLKTATPEKLHFISFAWRPMVSSGHANKLWQLLKEDYTQLEQQHRHKLAECSIELAKTYGMDRYDEAEALYSQAIRIVRSTMPETDGNFLLTLSHFADFEKERSHYKKAEALQREILAIRQKTLSANDLDIAFSYAEIANTLNYQGRYDEAKENIEKSKYILENHQPSKEGDYGVVSAILSTLIHDYIQQGLYEAAEKLQQQYVSTVRKWYGENHIEMASALSLSAALYLNQWKAVEAEAVARKVLNIQKITGVGRATVNMSENIVLDHAGLAKALMQQERYRESEKLFLQTLEMARRLLPNHSDVLTDVYDYLGGFYITLGEYAKAKSYLEEGFNNHSKYFSPLQSVWTLTKLGNLYISLGDYEKGGQLLQKGLAIRKQFLPENHPDIAESLGRLASLYELQALSKDPTTKQHLLDQAEVMHQQVYEVAQKNPLQDKLLVTALNNLAATYHRQNKFAEAERLYNESLQVQESKFKQYESSIATTRKNLADNYRDQRNFSLAETLYQQVMVMEQLVTPNTLSKTVNAATLASLQENEPNHEKILARADTLSRMALLQERKQAYTKALDFVRAALAVQAKIPILENKNVSQKTSLLNIRQDASRLLVRLVKKLSETNTKPATDLPEAFQALQLAHGNQRMQALQKTAMRLSSRNPKIQKKLQELWRKQTLWQNLDKSYVENMARPDMPNTKNAEQLRQKQAQAGRDIEKLDKALQREFPAYAQLIHPEPITLEKVQAQLNPDEALLAYLVDEKATYLFVVRPGQKPKLHYLESGQQALENAVNQLRASLQNPQQDIQQGGLKPFDLQMAYGLYTKIFEPAEADLVGVKHIFIVADDALQQLPLHVLVKTTPTKPKVTNQHGDYAKADWLAKHYAFSYLPAVHSLAYLRGNRNLRQGSHAKAPFIGFGDPLLKDGLVAKAGQMSEQFAQLGQFVALGGDPSATLREELPRVPQTATALTDIAKLLNVTDPTALYLGQAATESQIEQLSDSGRLSQHRIVGFATHALLPDIGESGLVLTPPPKSDKSVDEADLDLTSVLESGGKDDGYLTASEAAALDLDADWVLLAACNTATLQDTSEGLSQLAKGFFVAGARSVLASQWPVDASTMQQLMRYLFNDLHENPTLRRAEALQHSILKVLDRPDNDCNWLCKLGLIKNSPSAHPSYWAPFVILGEGGAIQSATESMP
jgi:CHAT domain-containing protein/tetratricopeptide (TPR) repeat protein